jgi:hypothetical protein
MGKQLLTNYERAEISLMQEHAKSVWGGIPVDHEWAINTQVWHNYKTKNKLTTNEKRRTK